MEKSDVYLLLFLEFLIILAAIYAFIRDSLIRLKERRGGAFGVARRGEKSMSIIYAGYGASMASFLALVTNADGVNGHKVALLLAPFVSITYLFFFSAWFRNSVLFNVSGRISKD